MRAADVIAVTCDACVRAGGQRVGALASAAAAAECTAAGRSVRAVQEAAVAALLVGLCIETAREHA